MTTPLNTNFVQPTKYLLTFDRIPEVVYFCQSVNLPGVSVTEIAYATPLTDVFYPSTKLEYRPFTITFIVDESLQTLITLQNWFKSFADPKSTQEKQELLALAGNKYVTDATLSILTALNNPIAKVSFYNVFPTVLSDIAFDTTLSADSIVTATVTFRYDYYDLIAST